MRTLIGIITISLLLLAPTLPAAKVYKWVDEQGNVHYGERPPTRKSAEELKIPKGPSAPAQPSTPDTQSGEPEAKPSFLETLNKEREEKARLEARAAQEQELRDKNCSQARKNLASQQLGGRRYEVTESGERKYLSAEESERRLQQAQRDVEEWCN